MGNSDEMKNSMKDYSSNMSNMLQLYCENMKQINNYNWSGLFESIRTVADFYSKIDYSAMIENIRITMGTLDESISKLMEFYNSDSFRMSINDIGKTLSQAIDSDFIEAINNIDVAEVIRNMPNASIADIANEIYDMAEEEHEEEEIITDQIVEKVISTTENTSKGWQEKLYDMVEGGKKKFFVVAIVLSVIYNVIIIPLLQETIGATAISKIKCLVREEPNANANIVTEMNANEQAIITDDVNYYYRVEYTDENGEKKVGYIAKRNIEVIKEKE